MFSRREIFQKAGLGTIKIILFSVVYKNMFLMFVYKYENNNPTVNFRSSCFQFHYERF